MKKRLWIPAIVFYAVNVVFCESVQVGTVLFTTTDLVRKCWTDCDKSLLKARSIMQDVLPDPDCIDFSNPEAVAILLDYFHACFQIIRTSTYGKVQNLMFLALSDALGGYLRAYVLPFTRRAYYAGQVKYSEAKKLFQLYDDIKLFLKTNGEGWAEPQKFSFRNFHVTPLAITGGEIEACRQLYTIETEGRLHCFNTYPSLRYVDSNEVQCSKNPEESSRENSEVSHQNSKRSQHLSSMHSSENNRNSIKVRKSENQNDKLAVLRHENRTNNQMFLKKFFKVMSMNETKDPLQKADNFDARKSRCDCDCPKGERYTRSYKRVIVPLPLLDDCVSPHSIAVPFKKQPLRNLKTRASAFVLEYYYIAVVKCLIAKGNTRADIRNFNSKFYSWLYSQVYPHLNDEQWYPAFGGVLRIMETIKRFGSDNTMDDKTTHDISYLFNSGVELESDGGKRREKARNVNDFTEAEGYPYYKRHVLTAIILVSLIWIFVFCACAFYFQATRGHTVFYEGYSEASSQTRSKDSRKKEKLINFQFLIRFFRKRSASEFAEDTQNVFWNTTKPKTTFVKTEKLCEPKSQTKDLLRKLKNSEKQRLIPYGAGDGFPALAVPEMDKQFTDKLSSWRYQPCLAPAEKFVLDAEELCKGDFKKPNDQRHQVEMLWKKPSMKLKRDLALKEGHGRTWSKEKQEFTVSETNTSEEIFGETSSNTYSTSVEDETRSTEKGSSSCCCSESYDHSHTTTSNTSSHTQVEEKLSSAATEFFGQVSSKLNPFRNGPKRKSNYELNSEKESSSSSESRH